MEHPNHIRPTTNPVRPVLQLAAACAAALAGIAYWNWWPAAFWASAASSALFLLIDLTLTFRAKWRRAGQQIDQVIATGRAAWVTHTTDNSGITSITFTPPRAASVIPGGREPAWRHRAPWWRRLWQRATPWWVVAISPLLIIPIGLAATPHAGADVFDDTVYLATLDYIGVDYGTTVNAIALGHDVCAAFDAGLDLNTIGVGIERDGGYTTPHAGSIIGAAVEAYCQQHTDKLYVDTRTALR